MLILTSLGFSQQLPRETLKGLVLNDSLVIENIKVMNTATNETAVSDQSGSFAIYAREKDTLVFSGLSYVSHKIRLTVADFKLNAIRIKLQTHTIELDEVVISRHMLSGNLATDSKNIKSIKAPEINRRLALATDYEDDTQSSPVNKLMPGYLDTTYMTDFIAIAGKIAGLFQADKIKKPIVFMSDKIFPEAVQEKWSPYFFTHTLQLKEDEVGLFLSFCENYPNARKLLNPRKELELIDFLIARRKEYQIIKKE